MSSETDRRGFLRLLGAGSATALAGNASGTGQQDTDDEPRQEGEPADGGGELRLISGSIGSLDPTQSTDTQSGEKIQQGYETLTHYPNGVSVLENKLIESVALSADLLTYTFTLKEGVQYHENPLKDELTAHDVKYSWRRMAEAEASQRANFILGSGFLGVEYESDEEEGIGDFNVVPDTLAIEVIDDYTLKVTLQQPETAALDILAYDSFAVMPDGLVGDIEGHDGEYTQDEIASQVMVGTGPFTLDVWETGSEIRMLAFDDYWGDGPELDSVHWRIPADSDDIWDAVTTKEVDIAGIPDDQYDPDLVDAELDDRGREVGTYGPIENGETLDYTAVPELSTFYVAFNAQQVPKAVRQAVAYVTNHAELVEQVFQNRGQEAFSFTPPQMWPGGFDSYQEFSDSFPYGRNETDLDGAQEVLEAAGFSSDDPFELTLTTYQSNSFQQFGRLARDKLSGLGVDLQLEEVPFNTLIERGQNGDLTFYSLGWIWSWVDPAYGLFGLEPENTDTDKIPGEADGYYLDWDDIDSENKTKAQDAWDRVENNPAPEDQDVRNEAFVEIEAARRGDMVLLPLYHGLGERFRYQWVNGPRIGALGQHRQQYNAHSLDASRTPGPPEVVDGQQPQDLDDDGVYEDIDGDGELTLADVQALYENRNDEAVQENGQYFDFNDDGEFSLADITALFESR